MAIAFLWSSFLIDIVLATFKFISTHYIWHVSRVYFRSGFVDFSDILLESSWHQECDIDLHRYMY